MQKSDGTTPRRPSLRRKYTIEEEHAGDYFKQVQRLKEVPLGK